MTHFIDFHVHPPVDEFINGPLAPFEIEIAPMTADAVADHYRERDGRAVILGLDTESTTRHRPFSNKDVAAIVASDPEVFMGLGSVDPALGAKAVAGIHGAARLGLAGLAFDPPAQGFDPSERSMFHMWDAASDHGLIVLFHTGSGSLGRGMPGGAGLRLRHGDPRLVDVVASLYPQMQVVIAHTGTLWRHEALAVSAHKGNVWLTLVGASATDYALLLDTADPLLDTSRILFGSGWAFSDLDEQLKGWDLIDDEVEQQVLHDNATRLLGLEGD